MAADDAERTEPATPKRLQDARRKGEVANSRDLSSVVVLVAALAALSWLPSLELGAGLARQAQAAWSGAEIRPQTLGDFHAVWTHHLGASARAFLPLALVLLAAGLAVSFAQTGPLFSLEALAFRAQRLDPLKGLQRMFQIDRLIDLAKAPLKLAVVGAASWLALGPGLDGVLALAGASPAAGFETLVRLTRRLALVALVGLLLLALLDLAWVRHRYQKRMRMTRREVRDELREREGSPQIRARRRQLQRDLTRQRMIADVARADVVITNPTHFAVALRYVRPEMGAPHVVARGRNHLAQRIRQVARQHDVPVVENAPLAQLLYRTARVGREIPESLYQAVAEVLAYVYRLDRRRAAAWSSS